jgi:hypothetical protein
VSPTVVLLLIRYFKWFVLLWSAMVALGVFGLPIALLGAGLAFSPGYRRWFVTQPGYVLFLSRLPFWYPPSPRRLVVAALVYVGPLSVVLLRWFLEEFRGDRMAVGALWAVLGFAAGALWFTGRPPFRMAAPAPGVAEGTSAGQGWAARLANAVESQLPFASPQAR